MGFEPDQPWSRMESINEFKDWMTDTLEEAKVALAKLKDDMAVTTSTDSGFTAVTGASQYLIVTTSTDSVFTDVIGYSQYLIMPKHLSKELAEPMNINWKTSSQVSTGLRMDKCQSSTIVINKLKTS